jgi:hypothetical protein
MWWTKTRSATTPWSLLWSHDAGHEYRPGGRVCQPLIISDSICVVTALLAVCTSGIAILDMVSWDYLPSQSLTPKCAAFRYRRQHEYMSSISTGSFPEIAGSSNCEDTEFGALLVAFSVDIFPTGRFRVVRCLAAVGNSASVLALWRPILFWL